MIEVIKAHRKKRRINCLLSNISTSRLLFIWPSNLLGFSPYIFHNNLHLNFDLIKMKGNLCCFLVMVMILLTFGLLCVSSRPFAPSDVLAVKNNGTYENPKSLQIRGIGESAEKSEEISSRIIGSMPPKCEHKCFGCTPCQPIQVPTTDSRLGVQYTNYEPEGWKCKCGPTFYAP